MRLRRAIPIAAIVVLAILVAPAGAQVNPTTPQSSTGSTTPSTGSTPADPQTPELLDPPTLLAIPPRVDVEIAAVLEAERRQAAVEEAKAVAAVEAATAEGVVAAAQSSLQVANDKLAAAAAVTAEAQSALEVVFTQLRAAGIAVDARRDRAAEIGVEMYTATGSERDPRTAMLVALVADKDIPDASTAKAYRDVVAEAAFGDLQHARSYVSKIKKNLAEAQAAVDNASDAQAVVQKEVDSLQADVESAQKQSADVTKAGQKRVKAAESEAPSLGATDLTGGLGILGDPLVPAADLAEFVRRTGRANPNVDLDALAATYIAEGKAEGVRSDVAWVQSIIETGWFSFKGSMVEVGDYNYAGIGACDTCSRGIIFDDMTAGVRSQIQLLRTYATKGLKTSDLANPPPRLIPEKSYVRGCCGTWMKLSGVWATGPGYGVKILTLYNQLLAFAASRRAS